VCEGVALLSVSPSFLFLLHAQPSTEHGVVRLPHLFASGPGIVSELLESILNLHFRVLGIF